MFDLMESMLTQLVGLLPAILGLYLIFDFIGSLLFGKK